MSLLAICLIGATVWCLLLAVMVSIGSTGGRADEAADQQALHVVADKEDRQAMADAFAANAYDVTDVTDVTDASATEAPPRPVKVARR